MKLVIDANILFSALIKDSLTAELLFEEDLELYAPAFFIEEFMKYEELILKKMKRSREKYIEILHCLKDIINSVSEEEFDEFLDKAKQISLDEKDISYVALALKIKCGIWSNDKKLKDQKVVTVYTTAEIKELLSK